jgi:mRNA interferase MazF
MIKKDYKNWMSIKAEINNKNATPIGYKEREIWICNIGENIGFEQDGKGKDYARPVLILKIYNRKFCHIIPLSTTSKRNRVHYALDGRTGKVSVALLSQSRAVDSARLHQKIGVISEQDFTKIKQQLADLLSL